MNILLFCWIECSSSTSNNNNASSDHNLDLSLGGSTSNVNNNEGENGHFERHDRSDPIQLGFRPTGWNEVNTLHLLSHKESESLTTHNEMHGYKHFMRPVDSSMHHMFNPPFLSSSSHQVSLPKSQINIYNLTWILYYCLVLKLLRKASGN